MALRLVDEHRVFHGTRQHSESELDAFLHTAHRLFRIWHVAENLNATRLARQAIQQVPKQNIEHLRIDPIYWSDAWARLSLFNNDAVHSDRQRPDHLKYSVAHNLAIFSCV